MFNLVVQFLRVICHSRTFRSTPFLSDPDFSQHVSATARSLTDTCRTLLIWIVSLGLGWEKLLFPISLLQVLGFALLV